MAKKILIVDDLIDDLTLAKKILESEKYEVTAVTNGASALDAIQGTNFDLIILDIQMPTLPGYDLMRLLRSQYDGKMPMIYLTIVPKKEVDLKDADGFIQKPYAKNDLLKEVKRILLKRPRKHSEDKFIQQKFLSKTASKKSPSKKSSKKSATKKPSPKPKQSKRSKPVKQSKPPKKQK